MTMFAAAISSLMATMGIYALISWIFFSQFWRSEPWPLWKKILMVLLAPLFATLFLLLSWLKNRVDDPSAKEG